MRARLLAALALIVALALSSSTLSANQGKGKAKGKAHAAAPVVRDDQGWERHDKYDLRIFGPQEGRPPGWSQGNKTGWRDCGLPPGQAKKYGCRTYIHEGRRYYYYQDNAGRIVVRRPRIDIHVVP